RLILRPHEPRDLDAFCAMEMDAEVRRYVGGLPRTREEAEQKFRTVPVGAIILKSEDRYIGRAGLHSAGIAFYIARPYWGRGFATEAARAIIDDAFRERKVSRINAHVETGNAASVRVLEKLGFKHVRHEPGEPRSFDHFELTAATSP
ncbi:MAG TPA: GNAT family N-acetyltransferase, partial [Thermoanaerobaculia bacterium]|nr:GNAT family N-acetyltransferase [Thermoanaerobaculia bacterium]